MKLLKRILLLLASCCLFLILFRGWIYRSCVKYQVTGERLCYEVKDSALSNLIDESIPTDQEADAEQLARLALHITSTQLQYTLSKNENDPNKLVKTCKAHCVGYASFAAATTNYLFRKFGLSNQWTARPYAGQLYFLGTNIHPYFHSPFFNDHDFVVIKHQPSGKRIAVDPTIADYFYINTVSERNQ